MLNYHKSEFSMIYDEVIKKNWLNKNKQAIFINSIFEIQ